MWTVNKRTLDFGNKVKRYLYLFPSVTKAINNEEIAHAVDKIRFGIMICIA